MQAAAQTYAPPTLAFCKNLDLRFHPSADGFAFSSPFVLIADTGAYTEPLTRVSTRHSDSDVDNNRFDRPDYSDAKNCAYISAISGDANSDTATSRARAPIA